jgi:Na+-transporting NADH:ubiquinone oxidoreductase subunit A
MLKIKKGLNLPIAGKPSSEIDDTKTVRSVAILGEDYPGMKLTMAVAVGDSVRKGQVLFSDKKNGRCGLHFANLRHSGGNQSWR